MKYTFTQRGVSAGNPIANALVVIVGALVIGLSVVLGFFAFIALGSVLLVLGAVIGLRVWWLNRKLRGQTERDPPSAGTGRGGVIEGEYRVVKGDKNS